MALMTEAFSIANDPTHPLWNSTSDPLDAVSHDLPVIYPSDPRLFGLTPWTEPPEEAGLTATTDSTSQSSMSSLDDLMDGNWLPSFDSLIDIPFSFPQKEDLPGGSQELFDSLPTFTHVNGGIGRIARYSTLLCEEELPPYISGENKTKKNPSPWMPNPSLKRQDASGKLLKDLAEACMDQMDTS